MAAPDTVTPSSIRRSLETITFIGEKLKEQLLIGFEASTGELTIDDIWVFDTEQANALYAFLKEVLREPVEIKLRDSIGAASPSVVAGLYNALAALVEEFNALSKLSGGLMSDVPALKAAHEALSAAARDKP